MTTPILELQAVRKEFGGIHALNAVSFALNEGQIVAVIGPNGAGKTTLINVITGVHRASSGQVAFRGEDVTGQRPFQAARRGLARTFQIVQPFPRMSVLENVAAGALFGGARMRMGEAIEAAREQLAFTGLTAFTDRPASALTLAGRKRLELAKSLAMRPQLLMLDEVNSGLNSSEIDGALALIRSIAGRGITILIIEHVMKVIFSLAERVLVLHHGELIADGNPGEIARDQRVIEAYLGEKFARRSPPPFPPLSQVGLARLAQHSAEPGQARVPPGRVRVGGPMSELLRIEGLSAGYGDVRVLWGLDLAVEAGEVACIVGPNGAGKTTLLRSISGLVPPAAGRIVFNGEEIGALTADAIIARGIAHVPEGRRLFRGLNVRDNLLLGAYLRRDTAEIRRDLDYVFTVFPILRERQRQDATTLSGGEQQMCAIGRGIMSRPKLLMIDELSLGLAPRLVERLGEALIEINRSGITILLVEQDVMTAFEIARHAFVLETGRITKRGTTAALSQDASIRQAYLGL